MKMKNKAINKIGMCLGLYFLCGCGGMPTGKTPLDTISSYKKGVTDSATYDTTGFLSNCKELMKNQYIGGLQGTTASRDSTGLFGFVDCYTSPETYEIIFVPKGGIEKRTLHYITQIEKNFDNGCNNNFSGFDCYAFVAPMRDPEKQEDMHAMNMDFPLTVRAYERVGMDKWKLISVLKANTFAVYSNFEFQVIYGKIK